MTQSANIRTLQVLPSRSADLCFSVPGVIAQQNYDHQNKTGPAFLGQSVQAFSIESQLYPHLSETITDVNDPRHPGHGQPADSPNRDDNARLKYDSREISKLLTSPQGDGVPAPFLFALRNESIAASLDQAIVRREGVYFERFRHGSAIQKALTEGFHAFLDLIPQLQKDALARFTAIDSEYKSLLEGKTPPPSIIKKVRSTTSVDPGYKVISKTDVRNVINVNGEFDSPDDTVINTDVYDIEEKEKETRIQSHKSGRLTGFPYSIDEDHKWEKEQGKYIKESQVSETTTHGTQFTETDNPSFFHPRLDNSISHNQLQLGLATELMQRSVASISAPHTERIIADERAAVDSEVRRLQVAFADSYLISPISGVITAVFKDVGESVQAGEPVLRIENDAVVFLVGRVQYFGILRIGQQVVVKASDIFESGSAEEFPGRIRGIRAHEADDDEWEIMIECDNPTDNQGRRKLPTYYQFDRDSTKISVV